MTDSKKSSALEPLLSEQFPINVLCNFINVYKGDRETLTAFLTNCQNALDLASSSQKTLLLKFIIARLEGKAQIACSNKIFDDFDSLKAFLKQNFGERKHYNHLLLELQSCKQQANESVSQFALRIETCLTDLQSEIHNSDSLKKDLSGRIAMTEDLALFTFNLGLQPRLSNNVRCRNPRSLNEAIIIATEEEKIQNLLYRTTPKSMCRICRKPGHSESECSSKQRRVYQDAGPSYSPRTYFKNNSTSTSHQNPGSDVFCRYCKNKGHDISQCRKRKYNNERKYSGNNNGDPAMHHVSYELPPSPVPSLKPDRISCDNVAESDNHLN